MKKNTSILPDELFNEEFLSHEEAFDNRSWEHMKSLLDEDAVNPVLIVPPTKNKPSKSTLFIIIMSTLSIFSLATWMLLGTHHTGAVTSESHNISGSSAVTAKKESSHITMPAGRQGQFSEIRASGEMPAYTVETSANRHTGSSGAAGKSAGSLTSTGTPVDNTPSIESGTGSADGGSDSSGPARPKFLDSVRMVSNGNSTYRIFTRKIWVPEEYEYIELPMKKTVQDFWMGIHFTGQRPVSDSSTHRESAGFNIQFMSGNRLKHNNWAAYGGFDWGMQFYGRSAKSGVVLNNTSQDSGFTRLRTYSMDFLGRGHFEYARFPIVPYVNVMAGPRLYSTGQVVASYLELKETESRTSHNAHTSVSMMYGVGIGARIKVGPHISLDARYEYMSGTPVRLVDMDGSTFNGLNYNLKIDRIKPTLEQFKVGIIFDVSERDYEKKLVKEGYYRDYMYDSLYVDPKDTNKIYLPCNCNPDPCDENKYEISEEEHARNYEEHTPIIYPSGSSSGNNNGIGRKILKGSSGSGTGSGSKGSFPGIKTSPSKPAERISR